MRKILFMVLLLSFLIIISTQVGAADGLASCTLTGNHYKCTGSIGANEFLAGDKHIHIYSATISYTGANGGTGEAGDDGTITITSDGKIKIEDTTFASVGGNGGDGIDTSFPPGGSGGNAGLSIQGDRVIMSNTDLTATSGTGGNGDADENTNNAAGGIGGTGQLTIIADYLNYTAGVIVLTGGAAGNPDAVAPLLDCEDEAKADADATAGANGGDTSIQIYINEQYISNVSVDANGGVASGADTGTSSCTDGSEVDCATACGSAIGGTGGTLTLLINGSYGSFDDFDFDIDEGHSALSDAVCIAVATGGGDCSECESNVGPAGGITTFTLDIEEFYNSNSEVDIVGSNGHDADASCDEAGDITGSDLTASNGGHGGNVLLYIYMTNGTFNSFNSTLEGGNGGEDEGADIDYPDNVDGWAGNGGNIFTYLYNTSFKGSATQVTGGDGHSSVGVGGSSGHYYMYFYNTNLINQSIWRYISGTASAGGSGTQYYQQGAGEGGNTDWYIYNDMDIYDSDFDLTGGISPSHGGACDARGGGGKIRTYNYGNLGIYENSKINMTGGQAVTCGEDGDTYIERSMGDFTLENATLNQFPAANSGDCENNFNGTFTIQDARFYCDSDGTATIRGGGVTQIDYKNGSQIDINGATGDIIWTYSGTNSVDKFLIWDSTFNDTTVNWNNETGACKFVNRTPASVGSVTFNGTCPTTTYDDYYTEVDYVSQSWKENITNITKDYPYSYLYYYCTFLATFPDDTIESVVANITWQKDGADQPYSEGNVSITSGVAYTSTAVVPGSAINISDNWTCVVNISAELENYINSTIVIPVYHSNLRIDIGDDGIIDYTLPGIFNDTLVITLPKDGLNEQLKDCNNDTCNLSIRVYSDEDSTLTFNVVNSSFGVDSPVKGLFNFTIAVFSEEPGDITTYPISWQYPYGDGDIIEISAHAAGVYTTYYITVIKSIFNESFPDNILYFEVYPDSITQQDVEPTGQDSGTPIWIINNTHETENIDIYLKLNRSLSAMGLSCVDLEFINESTPGAGTNINTTSYKYCESIAPGEQCQLWGYHDFSCTYGELASAVYDPVFIFDSLCSECVITQDAFDD